MNMKGIRYIFAVLLAVVAAVGFSPCAMAESVRDERKAIREGNRLYKEGRFLDAAREYDKALKANPASMEALFNMGLTQVKRSATAQGDSLKATFLQAAATSFEKVGADAARKPLLASKAFYNLGNMAFNKEDYGQAIQLYKQSLRLNPNDENARKNLRIAQLKKQDKDDNKDNKDQDKNQDQQNQDQQQDQNKDQNKDQQDQKEKEQPKDQKQQQQPEINQQTADQILKAMENKENELRAKVMKSNNGQQASGQSRSKKW